MLGKIQFFLLIGLVMIAGCGPANVPPISNTPAPGSGETQDAEAYPAPTSNTNAVSPEAYPAPTVASLPEEAYPALETPAGTLLALNRPIQPGDTAVSGVGPPGLPIFILNVTLMGEPLGSGVIGDDGSFSIPVEPLQANTRVGLAADIAAHGLSVEDVQPGEGQISIPQVGYFFDSVVIAQN
jgi:hypothetical protein